MKNALLIFSFLFLVPLASRAQYPGANEQHQENIRRGSVEEEARKSREANQSTSTGSSGRYNQYGDYIPGSHPGDTPYNTYPGPLAGKRKLSAWRNYRDNYKARKNSQKEARREYRQTH